MFMQVGNMSEVSTDPTQQPHGVHIGCLATHLSTNPTPSGLTFLYKNAIFVFAKKE